MDTLKVGDEVESGRRGTDWDHGKILGLVDGRADVAWYGAGCRVSVQVEYLSPYGGEDFWMVADD